jgi:O-antigen/teichoic acid export membrane protein
MIAALLGKESVGLYAIGYQFGMVIMMLTDAFSKAWQPIFYRYAKDLKFSLIKKIQVGYLLGLPVVAIIYVVVACWAVPLVVDERYATAIQFIPVVVAAYVAMGYYQLYFPYLILYKKTKVLVYITPTAALVNVLLNYWWLPIFGAMGAAYATLIAYGITSLSLYLYTYRLRKFNERAVE